VTIRVRDLVGTNDDPLATILIAPILASANEAREESGPRWGVSKEHDTLYARIVRLFPDITAEAADSMTRSILSTQEYAPLVALSESES
jgi:hypothetical protein